MYADAHGLVLQDLNIGDPRQRERIVAYYNNMNGMPAAGDPQDYSTAFRLALPEESARRQYIRALLRDKSPSYGQRVLGSFLVQGLADLVVTTNFDDLIEQAADSARSAVTDPTRPRLRMAALGYPDRAHLALTEDDFPLLVKLHGDFGERELKNLDTELRQQDEQLRQAFLDSSRRFGLAVIGYSGRDGSVMDMLIQALRMQGAFPAGLWWLTREPRTVMPSVNTLMQAAAAAGVSTRFVAIENFDETFAALARQAPLVSALRKHVDSLKAQPRLIEGALPSLDKGRLPVLRMNALPILDAPKQALRGLLRGPMDPSAIRRSLREAQWRGATATSGRQILAFGSASLLSQALDLEARPAEIAIDCMREDASNTELKLAYEGLTRGLARRLPTRPLIAEGNYRLVLRSADRERPDNALQAETRRILQEAYGEPLIGDCPPNLGRGPSGEVRTFAEAVRLNLEWRLGVPWLLFVPHTWVSRPAPTVDGSRGVGDVASAWRIERWVNRRNEKWAAIIDAWARAFAPDEHTKIPVLPEGLPNRDLLGGYFVLAKTTAHSRVAL
jgi:SIR2-like domain